MKKHVLHQENFFEPYATEQFAENSHWLLPQCLAFVGSKLPLAKTMSGKLSFRETLKLWKTGSMPQLDNGTVVNLLWIKHVFHVLNTKPRGDLLGKLKQSTLLGSRYAANVPLILSAFKEYRNVEYSQWDFSEPEARLFMDLDTFELISYFGVEQPWSVEELLEFQRLGRTVNTGANAGKVRSIAACTSITCVQDPEFKKLSRLMKLMLCQTWVYAPEIRSKYAITDLLNLDQPAPPLVDTDIFAQGPLKTDSSKSDKSKTDLLSQQQSINEMWL